MNNPYLTEVRSSIWGVDWDNILLYSYELAVPVCRLACFTQDMHRSSHLEFGDLVLDGLYINLMELTDDFIGRQQWLEGCSLLTGSIFSSPAPMTKAWTCGVEKIWKCPSG